MYNGDFLDQKTMAEIETYQKAVGIWRLERMSAELADQFGQGQFVSLPDVVEQTECMILHHHIVTVHCLLGLIHPTFHNVMACTHQVLEKNTVK
jgi:hypothetical protein